MLTLRFLLSALLVLLLHVGVAWLSNQPQDVGTDIPSGKLMSLSFAPFRGDQSPLEKIYPTVEQVDEDLRLLADKTYSIRTYSSLDGGLEAAPELARKYGIKMLQGCWLSSDKANAELNEKEVEALIKSANANPDVVQRVIVGNEVLLRNELDADRLIEYIRRVRRAVKQPVSYADVWSMYMKHPELIKEVDFITIHILPYWEDEPVAVEDAPAHLEKIVKQVKDEINRIAPGKPVLIGESGWPAAGRQRGLAVPSVVNEAKYIRDMIQVVNRHGFDYNIVEAFNQSWKSKLEGVVGANWGLFSVDRKAVFPLTGAVAENPEWQRQFLIATGLWLVCLAVFFKGIRQLSLSRMIVFLGLAQLFAVCLVSAADFLWYTSYSMLQRSYAILMVIANLWLGSIMLKRYMSLLSNSSWVEKNMLCLKASYLFFVVLALYETFSLSLNGRYLSFPLQQFSIPVFGVMGAIACQVLIHGRLSGQYFSFSSLTGAVQPLLHQRKVAYALYMGILGMIGGETRSFLVARDLVQEHPAIMERFWVALKYTLSNQQLLAWLACLMVMAIPFALLQKPENNRL